MKTNPNEPLNCNNGNGYYNDELNKTHAGIGLTKREYFASLILQGVLAGPVSSCDSAIDLKNIVQLADLFIDELNK